MPTLEQLKKFFNMDYDSLLTIFDNEQQLDSFYDSKNNFWNYICNKLSKIQLAKIAEL